MEDHHVDRPGVKAQQCVELTGPNSSIGLISFSSARSAKFLETISKTARKFSDLIRTKYRFREHAPFTWGGGSRGPVGRPGDHSGGPNTRSHSELGRENLQRLWYFVLRRGRVGRRQVFQPETQNHTPFTTPASQNPHHNNRGVEQPGSSSGS